MIKAFITSSGKALALFLIGVAVSCDRPPDPPKTQVIRKARRALTLADLQVADLWRTIWTRSAHDESIETPQLVESCPNVDPATIRLDSGEGWFYVRTRFTAANGRVYDGILDPNPSYSSDKTFFSGNVITETGNVSLVLDSPTEAELRDCFAILGGTTETIFPISFVCRVSIPGALREGTISKLYRAR